MSYNFYEVKKTDEKAYTKPFLERVVQPMSQSEQRKRIKMSNIERIVNAVLLSFLRMNVGIK